MRCQRTLLELGAGTGIVSCRITEALEIGQDILVATDLPEVSLFIIKLCVLHSRRPGLSIA
jgi:hypothetical protein